MANKTCPRCGSTKIVEYETSYECLNCKSEFKLNDQYQIEDENILTIQEMRSILEELKINENSDKVKKLQEILDIEDKPNHDLD